VYGNIKSRVSISNPLDKDRSVETVHAIQLGFAFVYLETKVESEKMADTKPMCGKTLVYRHIMYINLKLAWVDIWIMDEA
jgi:hypothetical protein